MPIPLIPLKLIGLALTGRTLVSKTGVNPFTGKDKSSLKPYPRPRPKLVHKAREIRTIPNPLQNLVKGLSSSLSGLSSSLTNLTSSVARIIQKPPKEDYNTIVKGFLPENSALLIPQFPANEDRFQMCDLDGDSEDELITSYRHGNEVKTLILKKIDNRWAKVTDITHSEYDNINYMGFADVTGEGRKQLLLGFKKKDLPGEMHGYTLHGGKATKLFTHKYNKFEMLNSLDNRGNPTKTQLAFWNKGDTVLDKIEVKQWNGFELEPVKNPGKYYYKKVLPVYGQRVKQQPQNPSNWFKLADALTKAGMYRDALDSVNIGMSLNPVSPFKEDFMELKAIITEKMKK